MTDKIDFSMFMEDYLNDSKEGFLEINRCLIELEKAPSNAELVDAIIRVVHTLKSSSKMLKFEDISWLAHFTEDILDSMRKEELPVTKQVIDVLFEAADTLEMMVIKQGAGENEKIDYQDVVDRMKKIIQSEGRPAKQNSAPAKTTAIPTIEKIHTVRVHTDILDSLFDIVGELIINKNRIDSILAENKNKELKVSLASMDNLIDSLQEDVSAVRLISVHEIFQKFPRMMRDLAKEENKEIEFILEGMDVELDKAVLDVIGEPLIHLLRNAVSHGIELPELRVEQNKNRSGTIRLAARRVGSHVLIEVEDDGNGIDPEHLKEVFLRKGLITPDEAKSQVDDDIFDLLFRPVFSSMDEVTGLSGRGVGLSIVKNSIEKLGGTVGIATQIGKWTRFTLKLPLTTALMQTLMVGVGDQVFIVPSDNVLETLNVRPEMISRVGDGEVLILHEEAIPFVRLNRVLEIPSSENQNLIALILFKGDHFMGMGVDALLDQTENIIKPFDPIAQTFKGFSGGTILGDGRVALLLDIPSLFEF